MKKLVEILSTYDLEKIFGHLHAGIVLMEKDGTLVSWNPAFEARVKMAASTRRLDELFPQKDRESIREKLSNRMQENWIGEFQIDDTDISVVCEFLLFPLPDERLVFIAERIESESTLKEVVEKLMRQVKLFRIESEFTKKLARNKQIEMEAVMVQAQEVAQVDPLTFLINRRMIVKELQDEVLRAQRYDSLLSVSVVDVDHFKAINDEYGHPIGDEVLRQVAHQLRDSVRHPDIVGRYGGEEFLILLPSSGLRAAAEQAARLCKLMRETVIKVKEHSVKVTLSIGVAQLKIGTDTWDSLLKRADNAMFEAKNNGRDCWIVVE